MIKNIFIAAFLFLTACGNNPQMPGNSPISNTTPKGIKLSISLPIDSRNAMDSALDKLFQDVRLRAYSKKVRHSDYTITIKTDCIDRNGTKVWLERLDTYDGTEYDQDPRPGIGMIYQAERVTLPGGEFKICLDTNEIMAKTTRYGAEHIILYYNDQAEYARTSKADHAHPIIK